MGQVYESVSSTVSSWAGALVGAGIEFYSSAIAASISNQAERAQAQGQFMGELTRAGTAYDVGKLNALSNRIRGITGIEGNRISSVGGIYGGITRATGAINTERLYANDAAAALAKLNTNDIRTRNQQAIVDLNAERRQQSANVETNRAADTQHFFGGKIIKGTEWAGGAARTLLSDAQSGKQTLTGRAAGSVIEIGGGVIGLGMQYGSIQNRAAGQQSALNEAFDLIEKFKYVRSNGISKRGTQRSKATVNRELSALSKIFELAIRERKTVETPVRLVKKFKEDNERVRYFKPDEEEGLEEAIDFAPSYLKSFVILTRHTGMRSGEALNLKIEQVDLQERTILLTKTKGGKSRRVPLNEIAYEAITSLIAGAEEKGTEYLFFNLKTGKPYKWLRRSFRTLMKRAGITDFKRHDLRHDAPTNMVESGASLIEVRDILGHSDIRMTRALRAREGTGKFIRRWRDWRRGRKCVPNLSQKKKSRSGDLL